MRSLDEFASAKLDGLEAVQLRRTPVVTAREGIWVERSSGSDVLDQAGLRAVERVFPLGAAVPAACRLGHGFSVTLPLEYRLLPAVPKQ